MFKLTCLVLLVAVTISRSYIEAKPNRYGLMGQYKRQIESDEFAELSEEAQELRAKEFLAGVLLMNADSDNSAEVDRLMLELKKAVEKKWDNFEDYVNHIAKVYEEVTGRNINDSNES